MHAIANHDWCTPRALVIEYLGKPNIEQTNVSKKRSERLISKVGTIRRGT
jgi:hypothetical protein